MIRRYISNVCVNSFANAVTDGTVIFDQSSTATRGITIYVLICSCQPCPVSSHAVLSNDKHVMWPKSARKQCGAIHKVCQQFFSLFLTPHSPMYSSLSPQFLTPPPKKRSADVLYGRPLCTVLLTELLLSRYVGVASQTEFMYIQVRFPPSNFKFLVNLISTIYWTFLAFFLL